MQSDWKNEAVEQALRKYLPVLTVSMSDSEVQQADHAYRILFRHDLDALGDINRSLAESVFNDRVRERLNKAGSLSLDGRKQLLNEDGFVSRVVSLSDFVQGVGEQILRGKQVAPDVRAKVDEARAQLNHLGNTLTEQYPQLEPQIGHEISESLLDCRFILEGGEPTSLRLHKYSEYLRLQKTR